MDWRTIQFDWNRLRAFLVTAEEGTFSAAGRALNMSQPTVGRQVAALEEELDVLLFERVGTSLELTPTGLDLIEHARAMADAATKLSFVAAGQSTSLQGEVSIAASEATAAYLLPPILARARAEHPGIELEIVVSNTASDLQRREADIAVRNFQPSEADLIARKIGVTPAHFYASAAYLDRIGPIEEPEDLTRAEIFAFDRTDVMIDGLRAMGLDIGRAQFPIATSNHLVQWSMCKQGMGICMMMRKIGDADDDVVAVLPQFAIPITTWLVSHRELRTNRRIRLIYDLLAEGLAEAPE